jgi:hypothetical protein
MSTIVVWLADWRSPAAAQDRTRGRRVQSRVGRRVGAAHPEFAMLLVAAATALIVATLVIEPTTERAAFRSGRPEN